MDQSDHSDLHFGSTPQTIIDNNRELISDMNVETPEQRVASNVSQQLLSNAFESQTQSKHDKDLHEFESELQTHPQPVPLDVFDQQFNRNIEEANEQRVTFQQQRQPFDVYEYEEEDEEDEEDEDSLEREPDRYESRAAVNEANIGSDLLFTTSPETIQSSAPITRGNEEVLYQLSEDSNILRAHNYGIATDLRIDSQPDQSLENVSAYGLNSSDPFRTPEKKVVQNKPVEDNYSAYMSGSEPFETVSTDFGISSNEGKSNLLDLDISSPESLPNMTAISHSNEAIDANRNRNHSQSSSESDDALDKEQDQYVVTSSADVSSLPTHTFAETVSLNDSYSDSTTTHRNLTQFESSSPPNLETSLHHTTTSSRDQSEVSSSDLLQDFGTSTQASSVEPSSETTSVPVIAKTMAKQDLQATSTTSGGCATCPFGPSAWFNPKQLNPTVAELVYWRNPKKSGIVFGSGLVILLSLTFFSIISVVAYASLAALSVTLSFRIYKNILQAVQKTNEGHPFKEYLELEITPSNERIHQTVDSILTHFNCTINKLRSVFLVEDIIDSLKFVVLFWCLTYIGSWFNGLTLVILAYLATFSLPKVYEINKTQIDHYLNLACTQINDITSKVRAKIPFPAKKEKDN